LNETCDERVGLLSSAPWREKYVKEEFQLDQMVELGESVQQLTNNLEILFLLDVCYHEDEDLRKCEFVPFIDY